MRFRVIAAVLMVSVLMAESVSAVGQVLSPLPGTITIPSGTVVPLTLVSVIQSKSTKIGDTIRAQVAFPVTVGEVVAIPAGSYVEGTLESASVKRTRGKPVEPKIHFSKLIYANGYTVSLDAVNHAGIRIPETLQCVAACPAEGLTGMGLGVGMSPASGMVGQAVPTPPALPPLHTSSTPIVLGVVLGAVLFVGGLLFVGFAHHRAGNSNYLLYDSGYQFSMVLSAPITVDGSQVASAAGLPQH